MSSPYQLRIFPAPVAAHQISVERSSLPTLITLPDLHTAANITLLESQVVATLIPLIKDYIAASAISSPTVNVAKVEQNANRVRETLPYTRNPAAPLGGHGTPFGF